MNVNTLSSLKIPVSSLGFGAMALSLEGRPSEEQAIATIHQSLDLGITLLDTADSYCLEESEKHHNERLINKALQQYGGNRESVFIITKGGFTRPKGDWVCNGNPDYLEGTIRESFQALGGEKAIDLWLYHQIDPNYSLKQSLTPVKQAVEEGLIRYVGLSNCSVKQLEQAREIIDIVAVENQYNIWCRNPETNGILDYCERENLVFLAWSPLGGISGKRRTKSLEEMTLLKELSKTKGISPYALMLAWLRAKSPVVVPIPGARRRENIIDSAQSLKIKLTDEEVSLIDGIIPSDNWLKKQLRWFKSKLTV